MPWELERSGDAGGSDGNCIGPSWNCIAFAVLGMTVRHAAESLRGRTLRLEWLCSREA